MGLPDIELIMTRNFTAHEYIRLMWKIVLYDCIRWSIRDMVQDRSHSRAELLKEKSFFRKEFLAIPGFAKFSRFPAI